MRTQHHQNPAITGAAKTPGTKGLRGPKSIRGHALPLEALVFNGGFVVSGSSSGVRPRGTAGRERRARWPPRRVGRPGGGGARAGDVRENGRRPRSIALRGLVRRLRGAVLRPPSLDARRGRPGALYVSGKLGRPGVRETSSRMAPELGPQKSLQIGIFVEDRRVLDVTGGRKIRASRPPSVFNPCSFNERSGQVGPSYERTLCRRAMRSRIPGVSHATFRSSRNR